MAIKAVLNPNTWTQYRDAMFLCYNDVLYLRLPSGRCIAYHRPRLVESVDRFSQNSIYSLSYEGWNSNPKKGGYGWLRMDTYGGELCNNFIQGACADVFRQGMLNVEAAGYPIVLHTHDELISEVPVGYGSIEEYEQLMMTPAPWCAHWPLKASGGWRGKMYRKE